jgi:hypothetical protein
MGNKLYVTQVPSEKPRQYCCCQVKISHAAMKLGSKEATKAAKAGPAKKGRKIILFNHI